MQQIIRNLWMLLCGVVMLTAVSCTVEGDEPGDVVAANFNGKNAPLVISLKVLSPKGFSILPWSNLQRTYAIFRGQKYDCDSIPKDSRTIIPNFYGLKSLNDYLLFGELDGTEEYKDEEIIIHWNQFMGYIKPDTITFTHFIQKDGKVFNSFKLNGEPVEGQMEVRKTLPIRRIGDPVEGRFITLGDLSHLTFNQIGLDLIKAMNPKDDRSFSLLPFNVTSLICMLLDGCPYNETALEILSFLYRKDKEELRGISEYEISYFRQYCNVFIYSFSRLDPDNRMSISDAIFTGKDIPIYSGYSNLIAKYYLADYAQLDFKSPQALTTINEWSYQKTQGLIPKILNKVDPNDKAYLLSTLYMKGKWELPFDREQTQEKPFYKADGTEVVRPMMYQEGYFDYTENERYQVLQMHFENSPFKMTYLLPAENISASQLLTELTTEELEQILRAKALSQYPVKVTMPCFDIYTDNEELVDPLRRLGLQKVFAPNSGLTELSPEDVYINKIVQKAIVKQNEYGCNTDEDTVEEVLTNKLSEEDLKTAKTFCAERPFIYLLVERSDNHIFLAGTYCGD